MWSCLPRGKEGNVPGSQARKCTSLVLRVRRSVDSTADDPRIQSLNSKIKAVSPLEV